MRTLGSIGRVSAGSLSYLPTSTVFTLVVTMILLLGLSFFFLNDVYVYPECEVVYHFVYM
jgi:hypothetical protein